MGIVLDFGGTQIERLCIGGRSSSRERIVGYLYPVRQDRRVEIDVAARTVAFGLDLLHDQRADLDGASSFWPGLAGVRRRIARIGDRHHHGPTLRLLRDPVG